MLNWFIGLFKGRSLESHLNATKSLRVNGIRFVIKKIDITDHLSGAKVMMQTYDTYKMKNDSAPGSASEKKIKEHFSHVIHSGVVFPKLSFKEETGSILIDKLFVDWDMVSKLYEEIMIFTYGKKKVKSDILQKKS
jgi:hypothetical protein